MSSFTLHDLDTELDARLSAEARRKGTSKNALAKSILARSLGLASAQAGGSDYAEFCGLWTVAEKAAFDAATADNGRIDPADWAP